MRNPMRTAGRGFTLIEVLVVMTISGILTAIAYPSYSAHVAKTRRGKAEGCILEYAQFLERNYTLALRYDQDSNGNNIALPALECSNDLAGFFTFASPTLTNTAFTVSAAPSANQSHADTACGCTMTLTQQGVKGVSSCSKTVKACWK